MLSFSGSYAENRFNRINMKKPGILISLLLIPLLIIGQKNNNDSISAVNKFESSLRQKLERAEKPNLAGRFKADFKSLEQYEIPQWYQDAKFGIFIHWGIFSVPAINDCWYGYWMYREKEDLPDFLRAHPYTATRAHHLKYYGPTDKFGYKDLIPLFTAEYFNANDWVTLFKKAGAKYVVPVAEFHDLFPMYDCSLTDWDAVTMGPKRDVVGEIRKATLANGLKFGVSSHRVFHQDEHTISIMGKMMRITRNTGVYTGNRLRIQRWKIPCLSRKRFTALWNWSINTSQTCSGLMRALISHSSGISARQLLHTIITRGKYGKNRVLY